MASLHCSASVLGFRRPNCRPSTTVLTLAANVSPTPSNFSFKNALRLQVRPSSFAVFASNTSPSNKDPLIEKSDGINTDDAGQGPPLLTILAGFLVFFLVFWIIGSILMWLISLIVRFPPSK